MDVKETACIIGVQNHRSGVEFRSCVKVKVAVLGSRPNEPYGFCGRKATLNHAHALVTVCP